MSAEQKFSNRLVDRRDFLKIVAFGGVGLAVYACNSGEILDAVSDTERKEGEPKNGDILVLGSESQLLRLGQRFNLEDLQTFLRRSKSKGKIFRLSEGQAKGVLAKYPQGKLNLDFKFIVGQGDIKRINRNGGEKLIYAQGFLSSDSRPYFKIIPRRDALTELRKDLKELGWDPGNDEVWLDSYIFTFSEDELKSYGISGTFNDPEVVKISARNFIRKRLEQNPLDQNNGFGHSLGGNYILEMAMAYPDAFNNLTFINSPIMGLDLNIFQKAGIGMLKENLAQFGVDPTKVIDYLSSLWNDEYHNKVKKFMTDFTRRRGRVLIVYTKGDVFAPRESTGIDEFKDIPGVEVLVVDAGDVNPFNPVEVFQAHGLTLSDKRVLNKSKEMVGKNLWNA